MKRNIALLLSLIMVFAIMPFTVFGVAAESDIDLDDVVFVPVDENDDTLIDGEDAPVVPTDDEVEPDAPAKKGDIDNDGDIDSMDYLYLRRVYFSQYALADISIGDIDNDGVITSMDYLYLRRVYFSQYVITEVEPEVSVVGKYMIYSLTVEGETLDYTLLYMLDMSDISIELFEDGSFVYSMMGETMGYGTYDAEEGLLIYEEEEEYADSFVIDGDMLIIADETGSVIFTKGELPEINPEDFEDFWGDEDWEDEDWEDDDLAEFPDIDLMTYEEYLAAEYDAPIYVESYVQGYFDYGDGDIYVFCQDPEGAYYTSAIYLGESLEIGTKVGIKGYKYFDEEGNYHEIWGGFIEVIEGDTFVAEPFDGTELLGSDELADYQKHLVALNGLTVTDVCHYEETYGTDIYLLLSYNGEEYDFYISPLLIGTNADAYDVAYQLEIGDVVDVVCFLDWYYTANGAIVDIALA